MLHLGYFLLRENWWIWGGPFAVAQPRRVEGMCCLHPAAARRSSSAIRLIRPFGADVMGLTRKLVLKLEDSTHGENSLKKVIHKSKAVGFPNTLLDAAIVSGCGGCVARSCWTWTEGDHDMTFACGMLCLVWKGYLWRRELFPLTLFMFHQFSRKVVPNRNRMFKFKQKPSKFVFEGNSQPSTHESQLQSFRVCFFCAAVSIGKRSGCPGCPGSVTFLSWFLYIFVVLESEDGNWCFYVFFVF